MRRLLVILTFFIYSSANAQTKAVETALGNLRNALLQRDTVALKQLLHDKVSYGHSNGWIESKMEVINDLYNGKLIYNKINETIGTVQQEGNTATVRTTADVDVTVDGKRIELKLHVFQVWVKGKSGWRLFGRQSIKI